MTKEEKNNIDRDFGEVITRTCSFCEKTYDISNFFSIPDDRFGDEFLLKRAYTAAIGKKTNKQVNDGICLKCMLKGISKICKNDTEQIKKCFDLYFKKEIVNNLDK